MGILSQRKSIVFRFQSPIVVKHLALAIPYRQKYVMMFGAYTGIKKSHRRNKKEPCHIVYAARLFLKFRSV